MKSTTYGSIYLFVLGWGEGVGGKFSALTTSSQQELMKSRVPQGKETLLQFVFIT